MLPISVEGLTLASKILVSRLCRPSTIDIDILSPEQIKPGLQLDQELSRATGCFTTDEFGLPCFVLVVKPETSYRITHGYVYYINRNHRGVRDHEIDLLKHHISYVARNPSCIRLGVVNLFCNAPQVYFLSAMIEGVDYTIGGDILTFKPERRVRINLKNHHLGGLSTCNLSHCDGLPDRATTEDFEDPLRPMGRRVCLGDWRTPLVNPDIVWIRDKGHLLGSFPCKMTHTINYLVVHLNQFLDQASYDRIRDMTKKWYPNIHDLSFAVTRLHFNTHRRCDDAVVAMAWQLICWFQPHVLVSIRENDIHYLLGNYDEINEKMCQLRHELIGGAGSAPRLPPMPTDPSSQAESDNVDFELTVSSQHEYPEVSFSRPDAEEEFRTSIKTSVTVMNEVARDLRRIRDSIVPPVHELKPHTDLTQSYLKELPSYTDGIQLMWQIWNRYAPTSVTKTDDRSSPRDIAGSHFVIHVTETLAGLDCLHIIDQVKKESIYLCPDNEAYRDSANSVEWIRRQLLHRFPNMIDIDCRIVSMTSYFQEDYPRVHLLMALYVISRLFHYSRVLPQKIIYGDLELRQYGHNICTELQLVNSLHNQSNGLLGEYGRLLPGAYTSLPSPMRPVNFVVPKDQCMFCKKRYKNNLGRHMSSAHGGQAAFASHSRLEHN